MGRIKTLFIILAMLISVNGCDKDASEPLVYDSNQEDLRVTPPPTAPVVPVGQTYRFFETSKAVFGNLVDNTITADGELQHSATGSVFAIAPTVLFDFGSQLDSETLRSKGESVVRWYDGVMAVAEADLRAQRMPDSKTVKMLALGMPILIEAYKNTEDDTYRRRLNRALGAFNSLILRFPELTVGRCGVLQTAIYNPLFLLGTVISLNAKYAAAVEAIKDRLDAGAGARLEETRRLIALMNRKFTCTDPATGHRYYCWRPTYIPSQADIDALRADWRYADVLAKKCADDGRPPTLTKPVTAEENNMPVMGLGTYFAVTGSPEALQKVVSVVRVLNATLWRQSTTGNEVEGAYKTFKDDPYIGLAENNTILHGMLAVLGRLKRTNNPLYDVLSPDYMWRTRAFYTWTEAHLYNDIEKVYDHDAVTNIAWCSGCNFMAIYNIMMYNHGSDPSALCDRGRDGGSQRVRFNDDKPRAA